MTEDRPDPRALRAALRELHRTMDDAEANEPHGIIVTDPQTGTSHVMGPYPNRLHAKIGVAITHARNVQTDPELSNLLYEVVLMFTPEGDTPEVPR